MYWTLHLGVAVILRPRLVHGKFCVSSTRKFYGSPRGLGGGIHLVPISGCRQGRSFAVTPRNRDVQDGQATKKMPRARGSCVADPQVKTQHEQAIPPHCLMELYEHVGWPRPSSETGMREVLEAGPAVGAWNGDQLVGFARALSDGHLTVLVEDVMVRERYRGHGVGAKLLTLLLQEVGDVAAISLFCEPPFVNFYERNGFRAAPFVFMQRQGQQP